MIIWGIAIGLVLLFLSGIPGDPPGSAPPEFN